MAILGVYYNGIFLCQNIILEIPEIKKNAQKTKILKHSNNFAVMAILGDFEEFEGPVPEPPYPYHHQAVIGNIM